MSNYSVTAYDTETCLAQLRVLASSNGNFIKFSQNKYTINDIPSVLDFLFNEGKKAKYNVFYNVSYDSGIILKPYFIEHETELRKKRLEELEQKRLLAESSESGIISEKEDESYLTLTIGNYKIKLVTHKGFVIHKGKKSVYFFDCANFYMSGEDIHMSLDTAAQKYLNIQKDEWGKENRERMGNDPKFFDENENEIIRYCIDDCKLTKQLFERTIESYENLGIKFPKKAWSKASIFKQYLRDTNVMEGSQKFYNLLKSTPAFKLIKNSYRGALNQIFGIGKFQNVTDADLNSAYPFEMRNLKDISNAKIIEYGDLQFDKCYYKFYEIETCASDLLGVQKNNTYIYPISTKPLKYFITEYDKMILDEWNRDYKILKGYGLLVPEDAKKPFDFIDKFFELKKEIKKKYGDKSVEYNNIKVLINAGYGVLAEHKVAETDFTNYVFASYITSSTRYRMRHIELEVRKAGRKPISISTDGITYTGDPIHQDNDEIGKLSVKKVNEYISFGTGIYRKDNVVKKRGFYSIDFDDLNVPLIKYEITMKPRPLSIVSAIIQKRTKEIGSFIVEKKEFSPYDLIIHHSDNPELIGLTISEYFNRSFWLSPTVLKVIPEKYK